jgi:hypothetical protein
LLTSKKKHNRRPGRWAWRHGRWVLRSSAIDIDDH